MKPEYYKDSKGEWRWQLRARNGEIIAASTEGFTRKWSAKRNYRLIQKAADEE